MLVKTKFLLKEAGARTLIDEVENGDFSILRALGAGKLRLEMVPVGWLCRFIVWLIFLEPDACQRRADALLRFFFPTVICKDYRHQKTLDDEGVVIYFNHQSLFEVLAVISWCLVNFPRKKFLFPVNLPWYEALAPMSVSLEQLGLVIVPMITPKTKKKMQKIKGVDLAMSERIKLLFERHYFEMIGHFAMAGNIIAVAPSATRTETIFPSRDQYHCGNDRLLTLPKTLSAIMLGIRKAEKCYGAETKILFVPFVALRRSFRTRGLNVFLKHEVYVGKEMTLKQMLRLKGKINFIAYRKLADTLPVNMRYPVKT